MMTKIIGLILMKIISRKLTASNNNYRIKKVKKINAKTQHRRAPYPMK